MKFMHLLLSATMNYRAFLLEPTEEGLSKAANLLRSGQLLAFPTETVYGLGADATNASACLDIFRAKGRPLTDPLIVHVADSNDAFPLIDLDVEERLVFSEFAKRFWPGPLTQIVKASEKIPPAVTANTGFVGIRCPKHRLARILIRRAGVPVAAPSANRFGHVSPTRAGHVLADLCEKGVMVLNGESEDPSLELDPPCEFGIESTVAKLNGKEKEVIIFRQGAVSQRQLESCLVEAGFSWTVRAVARAVKMHAEDVSNDKVIEGQVAPGQAVTHYAPDIPCYIINNIKLRSNIVGSIEESNSVLEQDKDLLVLSQECLKNQIVLIDFAGLYSEWADRVCAYRDLSPSGDSSEAARVLFDTLRWAENVQGASHVLLTQIQGTSKLEENMSLGLADRIFRASSGMRVDLHVTP